MITIKQLEKQDFVNFVDLVKLFGSVFEIENFSLPSIKHLQSLFDRDDFEVFAALKDDKVVGGLTIYLLQQYYAIKPLAYLYDLAVDPRYQGQGIGKKLIEKTKISYTIKGFEEMFVQAGGSDNKALDFYRKTAPSEEDKVVHFTYKLNT